MAYCFGSNIFHEAIFEISTGGNGEKPKKEDSLLVSSCHKFKTFAYEYMYLKIITFDKLVTNRIIFKKCF